MRSLPSGYTHTGNKTAEWQEHSMIVITTTMTYDMENRMKVFEHNGAKTTYSYDGDGLKRSESVSGTMTTAQ